MKYGALTDRNAVLKAVQEFDKLGREDFLTKYGFKKARSYFLELNGKLYDFEGDRRGCIWTPIPWGGALEA